MHFSFFKLLRDITNGVYEESISNLIVEGQR